MVYFHPARTNPNENCIDYCGNKRVVGERYLGPDGCNKCKCAGAGHACTKKGCPEGRSILLFKYLVSIRGYSTVVLIFEDFLHFLKT